jgi:hypothetical protein
MKRKITFHIGFEKTGNYSFQRFCAKNASLLNQHDVLYPIKSLAFDEHNHAPLVASYLDYDDFTIRSSGQPRPVVLRSVLAEIAAAENNDVLISAEHLSSRFRDREIFELAADFADFDCRVVVREHRARFFSAYNQSVRSGRDVTLEAYCDEVFHPSNWYLRYATTIGAWERAFGTKSITVLCYSADHDIVPVLCSALISPDLAFHAAKADREHLSIGPGVTEWLRRANSAIGRIPGAAHPAIQKALRAPRRGLVGLARKLDRDTRPWQLSERNWQRLNEIAAFDNDWLKTRYGIQLAAVDQTFRASARDSLSLDVSGAGISPANL